MSHQHLNERDKFRALLANMVQLRCQIEDCIGELDLLLRNENLHDPSDLQTEFLKRNSYLAGGWK